MDNIYQLQSYYQYGDFPLCVVSMQEEPQTTDMPHLHDCSELAVITSGEGEYLFEGISVSIHPGDVLLIHPGFRHNYQNTRNLRLVNILYDSRRLPFPLLDGEELPNFHTLFPLDKASVRCSAEPIVHLSPEKLILLKEKILSLSEELDGGLPGTGLCCMAKFLEILVLLLRCLPEYRRSKIPERNKIARAVAFINKHFNSQIEMRQLAKIAFMSPRHFFREFRQVTGYTPLDFLHRRRLHHALILLKTTQHHIDEIAFASGFSSSTYFCRKFKESFHCTPRHFRQQNHEAESPLFNEELYP